MGSMALVITVNIDLRDKNQYAMLAFGMFLKSLIGHRIFLNLQNIYKMEEEQFF